MVAGHTIKTGGKWYMAGMEVPEASSPVTSDSTSSTYTKTEINRMSTADLQSLATKRGISDAESISGADLKKILIQKFNL